MNSDEADSGFLSIVDFLVLNTYYVVNAWFKIHKAKYIKCITDI